MDISENCMGETLSLKGEDEEECFEGLDSLKYLVQLMRLSDDDWPEILRNIHRSIQVWGRLGKFRRREGADLTI